MAAKGTATKEKAPKTPKLKKDGTPRKEREVRDPSVLLKKAEDLRTKKLRQVTKLDGEITALRAKIDAFANVAAEAAEMTPEQRKAEAAALAARAAALRAVDKVSS